jgi:hypothetical protein
MKIEIDMERFTAAVSDNLAELQALRDERDKLRATVARVEALVSVWRREDEESACHGCADEVDTALRGEP